MPAATIQLDLARCGRQPERKKDLMINLARITRFCIQSSCGFVLFVGLTSNTLYSAERVYTTEGNLHYKILDQQGNETYGLYMHFVASVSNRSWHMRTDFKADSSGLLGNSEESGCDGTNVFTVLHSPQVSHLATPGRVSQDGLYPSHLSPHSRVIWLALASSDFLAEITNREMIAPWSPAGSGQSLHFRLASTLPASGLPRDLIFDSLAEIVEVNRQTKKQSRIRTNYTAANYAVIATTNLGDILLPREFELMRFFEPQLQSELEALPRSMNVYRAEITSLRALGPESILPKIARPTHVIDGRFRDTQGMVSSIRHTITNNVWPDRDDKALQALFKRDVQRANANVTPRFDLPLF